MLKRIDIEALATGLRVLYVDFYTVACYGASVSSIGIVGIVSCNPQTLNPNHESLNVNPNYKSLNPNYETPNPKL